MRKVEITGIIASVTAAPVVCAALGLAELGSEAEAGPDVGAVFRLGEAGLRTGILDNGLDPVVSCGFPYEALHQKSNSRMRMVRHRRWQGPSKHAYQPRPSDQISWIGWRTTYG